MDNTSQPQIVARFFEAIYSLKANKRIRGKGTIYRAVGADRWNMAKLEADHTRDLLKLPYVAHLIAQYSVSAKWLMTGEGEMFEQTPI